MYEYYGTWTNSFNIIVTYIDTTYICLVGEGVFFVKGDYFDSHFGWGLPEVVL